MTGSLGFYSGQKKDHQKLWIKLYKKLKNVKLKNLAELLIPMGVEGNAKSFGRFFTAFSVIKSLQIYFVSFKSDFLLIRRE